MSKHDNDHDDVPITFAEPVGRTRVPHPINQPNWRYNKNPQATKAFVILFCIRYIPIIILIPIGLIVGMQAPSPMARLIANIVAGIYVIVTFIYILIVKKNKRLNAENARDYPLPQQQTETRKKKYPKHRKDYR